MKNTFFFIATAFTISAAIAQNINLDPAMPAPQFQEADAGAIEFGDVDNDGDNDFIATGKGGPVLTTLYKNDGIGNFTAVANAPFVNVFGGAVAFADIDNDNDLDLLITGNTQGASRSAELYTNDGSGNYTKVTVTPFEPNWGGDLAFADIDNDGDQDVIMTGIDAQDNGISKLYTNNGSGVFAEVSGTPFVGLGNSSVAFFDMDNDGDKDVLMAGENSNAMPATLLYANDSTGNFTLVSGTPFDDVEGGDIAIADSDNDGDLDVLISGSAAGGTITKLYLNNGSGSFALFTGASFAGASTGETDFADFDNDGDMDVLITGFGSSVIALVYENLGGNNFVVADSLAGAYLSSTAIGDIDGDNVADVIIAGTSFTAPVRSTKTYINQTPNIGFEEQSELPRVSVFPNPAAGSFRVDAFQNPITDLKIYSTTGELIYADANVETSKTIQLKQPAGLYFLVIETNGETKVEKLILKD